MKMCCDFEKTAIGYVRPIQMQLFDDGTTDFCSVLLKTKGDSLDLKTFLYYISDNEMAKQVKPCIAHTNGKLEGVNTPFNVYFTYVDPRILKSKIKQKVLARECYAEHSFVFVAFQPLCDFGKFCPFSFTKKQNSLELYMKKLIL